MRLQNKAFPQGPKVMTTTTIYKKVMARLTIEQLNYLKGYAERNGVSYNFLIRKAVDSYIKRLTKREKRIAELEADEE